MWYFGPEEKKHEAGEDRIPEVELELFANIISTFKRRMSWVGQVASIEDMINAQKVKTEDKVVSVHN
jgi:hypothetical protein